MSIEEHSFVTIDDAANALAHSLTGALSAALSARGLATLVVSGGRTPRHVFEKLRHMAINWSRITITLTDERWVPPDHADSNERLVRAHLLQGPAAAAAFVPLYGGETSPAAGQPACETRLAAIARPFDAVYLGLGGDGHIASLFPGDGALDVDDSLCVAVAETLERQGRMSLTAAAILQARQTFLLFSGPEKQAIYAQAKRAGPYREIPLRLILAQERTPVGVFTAT